MPVVQFYQNQTCIVTSLLLIHTRTLDINITITIYCFPYLAGYSTWAGYHSGPYQPGVYCGPGGVSPSIGQQEAGKGQKRKKVVGTFYNTSNFE